jgi:hypothetical protein
VPVAGESGDGVAGVGYYPDVTGGETKSSIDSVQLRHIVVQIGEVRYPPPGPELIPFLHHTITPTTIGEGAVGVQYRRTILRLVSKGGAGKELLCFLLTVKPLVDSAGTTAHLSLSLSPGTIQSRFPPLYYGIPLR